MEKAYKNISYLFVAVLLMAFVGFSKTYFGLFPSFQGVTSLIHFHVLMALLWLAMLIIQPILIRQKKLNTHRLLGKISYGLVPLIILSMVLLMRTSLTKPNAILIGISDMIFFVVFYLLAIIYKHKLSYHIRFMVMTVLPFINPSLGRLMLPGPILGLIIIAGLLIYERFHAKIYKPYVIALVSYLAVYIIFIFIVDIRMWNAFWGMIF